MSSKIDGENWKQTFTHKFKCHSCSLHFAVYSWSPTWPKDRVVCPECFTSSRNGSFCYWIDTDIRQIYELVPGESDLIGMLGEFPSSQEGG